MDIPRNVVPTVLAIALLSGLGNRLSAQQINDAAFETAQEVDSLARPAFARGAGPLVLYDTAHFNPPLNEGRYKAVSDLLRADGYEIVAGRIPFDSLQPSPYRILFMVTPFAADRAVDRAAAAQPVFSEGEAAAIEAWVRRGGSLLFVVGHEPSGAAHASLARRFGVELRNGTAMDSTPANNWVDGHPGCRGCLKFTRENGLLRSHAINLGRDSSERVSSVISAAGQSVRSSSESHVLLAMGSAAFDVLATKDTVSARGRAHAVALSFGAGRVVVIGDGSILSGFTYGPESPRFRRWWPKDPDNRQFTLNVMHWLSGLFPEPQGPGK